MAEVERSEELLSDIVSLLKEKTPKVDSSALHVCV